MATVSSFEAIPGPMIRKLCRPTVCQSQRKNCPSERLSPLLSVSPKIQRAWEAGIPRPKSELLGKTTYAAFSAKLLGSQ